MADLRRTLDNRLPVTGGNGPEVARAVNAALDGYLQSTGTLTLTAGAETVIRAPIFRASTVIILVPRSSAAAALSWWVSAADVRQITIGHDAAAGTEEFSWVAIG